MKRIFKVFTLIAFSATSLSALAAQEVTAQPAGQQRFAMITATSDSSNLSELLNRLDAKATAEGAGSYRVISASGNNHLYGSAEIYK